jgi:hypothetical protein
VKLLSDTEPTENAAKQVICHHFTRDAAYVAKRFPEIKGQQLT